MTDSCIISCLQQSAEIATPAISNALTGLLGSLGGGALLGFFAGFTLRKLAKIAMFIIGFFVLGLMVLHYKGIFRVDWKETEDTVKSGLEGFINEVTKIVSSTAKDFNDGNGWMGNDMIVAGGVTGFTAGFLLGLKKG
jgi:uncharacterized membrane protein (Fun14 family)